MTIRPNVPSLDYIETRLSELCDELQRDIAAEQDVTKLGCREREEAMSQNHSLLECTGEARPVLAAELGIANGRSRPLWAGFADYVRGAVHRFRLNGFLPDSRRSDVLHANEKQTEITNRSSGG
jgi:hypothetical protein